MASLANRNTLNTPSNFDVEGFYRTGSHPKEASIHLAAIAYKQYLLDHFEPFEWDNARVSKDMHYISFYHNKTRVKRLYVQFDLLKHTAQDIRTLSNRI